MMTLNQLIQYYTALLDLDLKFMSSSVSEPATTVLYQKVAEIDKVFCTLVTNFYKKTAKKVL